MNKLWVRLGDRLGQSGRLGLMFGALVIAIATVAFGYVCLRTDYQVLFADLSSQDAAAMTAELDRIKVPYVLSGQTDPERGDTATILVDRNEVYRTRIKLMGKDIPLHGAVGFELFNNNDLGMTEFSQRINYQRALQGEITRTILGLKEIRDARVLLVLPEQGLFKQATSRAKASITLTLKAGQSLRKEQVAGIQRLVSAAVPGIQVDDVTLVDQSGIALTRSSGSASGDTADAAQVMTRLELKRDMEDYLLRKASAVLDRSLGLGVATASVDVTLNMDRVQSSTDEPVAITSRPGNAPTGVLSRERSVVRESSGTGAQGAAGVPAVPDSSQRETEYVVGRHVEQVVTQPGSLRRIQVAVVVHKTLSTAQQESLRQTVAAAVGASFERGDSVVLQLADPIEIAPAGRAVPTPIPGRRDVQQDKTDPRAGAPVRDDADATRGPPHGDTFLVWLGTSRLLWMGAAGVLVTWVLILAVGRRPRGPRALSDSERQEVLLRLRQWEDGSTSERPAVLAEPGRSKS